MISPLQLFGDSLSHFSPPTSSAFPCHENGATVLQYAPKQQLLITGGRKGFVCVFDIRQRQLLHTFQAHDSAIKALALDAFEDFFVTGSAEGNMKVTQALSLTWQPSIHCHLDCVLRINVLLETRNYFFHMTRGVSDLGLGTKCELSMWNGSGSIIMNQNANNNSQ